jgi:hypothetical protein
MSDKPVVLSASPKRDELLAWIASLLRDEFCLPPDVAIAEYSLLSDWGYVDERALADLAGQFNSAVKQNNWIAAVTPPDFISAVQHGTIGLLVDFLMKRFATLSGTAYLDPEIVARLRLDHRMERKIPSQDQLKGCIESFCAERTIPEDEIATRFQPDGAGSEADHLRNRLFDTSQNLWKIPISLSVPQVSKCSETGHFDAFASCTDAIKIIKSRKRVRNFRTNMMG